MFLYIGTASWYENAHKLDNSVLYKTDITKIPRIRYPFLLYLETVNILSHGLSTWNLNSISI